MKKKLMLLLCLITCMFAITACSEKEEAATFKYDEANVKDIAIEYLDSWNQMDWSTNTDEMLDQYLATGQIDKTTKTVFATWRQIQTDIGTFAEIKDVTIKEYGDSITVVITAAYKEVKVNKENGEVTYGKIKDIAFKVPFDSTIYSDPYAIVIEEIQTLGTKMQDAGLNTILGMGTVFVVLIFISFLIGLFRFIPKIQEKMSKKQVAEVNVVEAIDNTLSQIAEQEEEQVELVDDGELVAVITAAIMASMAANGVEIPADGLVVRSIKRAKSNKWQKA